MTLHVSGELQLLIQHEIATGQYHSQDEVLTQAVRMLRDRREKLELLRKDIEPALGRLDCGLGEPLDLESIKAEARQRFERSKTSQE